MQAFFERQPQEALGIELSEMRHNHAVQARTRVQSALRHSESSAKLERLRYINGDIFDSEADVSRCSKIFVFTTVYPNPLLRRIEKMFQSMPFLHKPVLVASTRELKEYGGVITDSLYPGTRWLRNQKVMTSWGAGFISVYRLHA